LADQKKTLSAKEAISDIRAGASDEFLMKKYGVSEKGLKSLFQKLVEAKVLTQDELDGRGDHRDPTTATQLFKCPSCGLPQNYEFKTCPQCGIIVEKFFNRSNDTAEPVKTPPVDREPTGHDTPHLVESPLEQSKRAFEKVLELVKVPRNAAVAGVVGTIIVVFVGYLIFSGPDKTKSTAVTQNITEIPPKKAEKPALRVSMDGSQVKRPAPDADPRNSTLPESRGAMFPDSSSSSALEEPSYVSKDYATQQPTPPVTSRPKQPKSVDSGSRGNQPKQFASIKDAAKALGAADGNRYLRKFPYENNKQIERLLATPDPKLYEFWGNVVSASRNAILIKDPLDDEAKFIVKYDQIPLRYSLPSRGDYWSVIGKVTGVVASSTTSRLSSLSTECFIPVITPIAVEVLGNNGREIYMVGQ